MPEKSDHESLILIGAGIIIGAAFIFLVLRKLPQTQTQSPPAPAPQPVQTVSSYKQDTEFIKWYTETIVKPSIQQVAREAADKAIKQFMEANPRTEVQALGSKTAKPRAKTGVWMITRDSEGAITSIETVKDVQPKSQKDINAKPPTIIPAPASDKNINMGINNIL
jgi:hypothetical protein